jgi:hypothetical protein
LPSLAAAFYMGVSMCEPQIDARRAERKHQCVSTGRHQHARRKRT